MPKHGVALVQVQPLDRQKAQQLIAKSFGDVGAKASPTGCSNRSCCNLEKIWNSIVLTSQVESLVMVFYVFVGIFLALCLFYFYLETCHIHPYPIIELY